MSHTNGAVEASPTPRGLFTASRPITILEDFRIPYDIAGSPASRELDFVRSSSTGRAITWACNPAAYGAPAAATLTGDSGARIPVFARLVSDRSAPPLLAREGGSWKPIAALVNTSGDRLASVWQAEDGGLFVPFDPDEVRLRFLSESYHEVIQPEAARRRRQLAMQAYYRARDVMPRPVQIWLRRGYARLQARTRFPRWPIETALHDFLDMFVTMLQTIADEPVPTIACWPNGNAWALVLTHDVETSAGVLGMQTVLEIERSHGVRSSWNFVPRRYEVSTDLITDLVADGFEVGVHGLYHDGRDLESEALLRERLPAMRDAGARWGAAGFRSPATHRDWRLMPLLGFDYDSSYPDTDPFEPQSGGCCSWLPFFNQEMVELPLTMPQDHTLFTILRQTDERTWVKKAEFLRQRGGMALIDTHPDYLTDGQILTAYQRFLERFAHDESAWRALPGEVSSWWRRRSQSSLEREGSEWVVRGPAATDGRIELLGPDGSSPGTAAIEHPSAV